MAVRGSWAVESFARADAIVPGDPGVTTEVTFDDGQATGTAGVNRFRVSFEATDVGAISFGMVASTRMAGPENAMTQETGFFAALERVERFEVTKGKLVLRDGDGTLLVVLAPT